MRIKLQSVQNFCIFAALDLTLVDLPGLVKNPTQDQDENIEQQVNSCLFVNTRENSKLIFKDASFIFLPRSKI